MSSDHAHHADHTHHAETAASVGWPVFEWLVVVVLVLAAAGYGWLLWSGRHRSSPSPWRPVSFSAGLLCVGAGLVGPLAHAGLTSFTAHMVGHLLVGMLGPLLLVLGAPVRVALRGLTTAGARRVTRVLRFPVIRWVTHPVVAAILDAVAVVGEVASVDVPAMSHPVRLLNISRPDEVRPGLTPDQALAGAPQSQGQRFEVPRILGEE